jgi:ATP-dependent Clp protease ATP-binding subunit ClpC
MNESTLTQLKILVEQAVRPVRASLARKRIMREELLVHVSGVFEEEFARLGEERAALGRTALRFGNPADVAGQLQASVPAGDRIRQFWEGPPGESTLRTASRLAGVTTVLALVTFAAALLAAGGVSPWSREALTTGVPVVLALPLYLFGLAFLTGGMEKALHGPGGRSWLRVAPVAAGSVLLTVLCVACVSWPAWPADGDPLGAVLVVGGLAAHSVVFAGFLAQSSAARRRYHEEWGRLPIEMPS